MYNICLFTTYKRTTMTLNNRESDNKIIQSPLLKDLCDSINAAKMIDIVNVAEYNKKNNENPLNRVQLVDAEISFAIRKWKKKLEKLDVPSVIDLVKEISNTKNQYIRDEIKPLVVSSLDKWNIVYLLSNIQYLYSSSLDAIPQLKEKVEETDIFKVASKWENIANSANIDWTKRKRDVKLWMKRLYKESKIDGRYIFWLLLFINQDKKELTEKYSQFPITFLENINKRMYGGEHIYESFWNEVTDTAPQKTEVIENTKQELASVLTDQTE